MAVTAPGNPAMSPREKLASVNMHEIVEKGRRRKTGLEMLDLTNAVYSTKTQLTWSTHGIHGLLSNKLS